ncbi:MAG: helix-turn-helix domain-containing protein [Defluviitaleaceae bacterium]|nr:helix-turn-helix domain-containing protein [Defluviitaleaceae bacterium]
MIDGKKIRELRINQGKSLLEVGNFAGISESMMGHIENGRRIPNAETIKLIADYLGTTVDSLYKPA